VKKLIVNIGQEAVVGVSFEAKGKEKTLDRVFEFPTLPYYNNSGMIDFQAIAATIKKVLPKDVRSCDIDLILPTHVTDVEYLDAVDAHSNSDKKKNAKLTEKHVYIGENQTKRITEKITFNTKLLSQIITAFHKEKLSVVRALSNVSCYHNFMAIFNQDNTFAGTESKTHICIVWGSNKIQYIIMVGNLPVEIRTSDLKFTDVYRDVSVSGGDIPFNQILKAIDSFTLSPVPEVGLLLEHSTNQFFDGERSFTLSDAEIDTIKVRFHAFLTDLINEIRTLYDYVGHQYNTGSVFVCTNSRLVDECICKTVSDTFPIEYLKCSGPIDIYNDRFNFRSIAEITDRYAPILGSVIDEIKKGGDFYDA
jgi:hypothetical protein